MLRVPHTSLATRCPCVGPLAQPAGPAGDEASSKDGDPYEWLITQLADLQAFLPEELRGPQCGTIPLEGTSADGKPSRDPRKDDEEEEPKDASGCAGASQNSPQSKVLQDKAFDKRFSDQVCPRPRTPRLSCSVGSLFRATFIRRASTPPMGKRGCLLLDVHTCSGFGSFSNCFAGWTPRWTPRPWG